MRKQIRVDTAGRERAPRCSRSMALHRPGVSANDVPPAHCQVCRHLSGVSQAPDESMHAPIPGLSWNPLRPRGCRARRQVPR